MAEIDTPDSEVIGVGVAGLQYWLDASNSGLKLAAPPGHAKFLLQQTSEVAMASEVFNNLVLHVRDASKVPPKQWYREFCRTEIWELWQDTEGRFVFIAPRQSPSRYFIVDADFKQGEVFGYPPENADHDCYPLPPGLETVLIVNWLAGMSDFILHAAGVAIDGQGYCFIGTSGAGKSTLAASLAADPRVTVLGEDQVIVRYIDHRFWVYGTPWHLNPAMCSPLGIPLSKIFFLEREPNQNRIKNIKPFEGVTRILQTAFIPYYRPDALPGILDHLALLIERMPLYTLSYQIGSDVMKLVL